jgi:MFS transporter, DHA1 family, inner membrane transport protein
VLGLNITVASVGWLAATGLGGFIVSTAGFTGLGVITCLLSAIGAGLAIAYWRWPTDERAALVVARGER